jgi:hypothetical protein
MSDVVVPLRTGREADNASIRVAIREGETARRQGLGAEANPYKWHENPFLAHAWGAGFRRPDPGSPHMGHA